MPDAANVLLIHADQHRFDCVGANQSVVPAGPGRLLKTPNLDRLATEGTNFRHAYTPCPVCTPARASLATGTWPSRHGAWVIKHCQGYRPADPKLPTLWQQFADAGHRVAHVGKYHGEVAGDPVDHGATTFLPEWKYDKWRADLGLPRRPRTNNSWGEVDPHADTDTCRLGWGATHAIGEIEAARQENRPFFVRWDPSEPHLPCIVPEPWASLVKPSEVPPWPSFGDDLSTKPICQRLSQKRWGCDGWAWEDWQPIVARYLGEIMLLDHHVGRLLDRLDALGVADDTLVIYTADHGDFCGGHGMVDKHYCGYDDILRVPLLARGGGFAAGRVRDDFVSHEIDLATTLLAVSGIDVPETFAGRDLQRADEPRSDIFSQYGGTMEGVVDQRYLRDERWKYVYGPVTGDELYDLKNDPAELHNVVDDSAHANELARLRGRMMAWMAEVGDQLNGPDWRWPARVSP
jgi:arylsulfatase A-like enzyme